MQPSVFLFQTYIIMMRMNGMSGPERSFLPHHEEFGISRDVPVNPPGEGEMKLNKALNRRAVLQFEYAEKILKTGDIAVDLHLWTNQHPDGGPPFAEVYDKAWEASIDEKTKIVDEVRLEKFLKDARLEERAEALRNQLKKAA